MCAGSRAEGAEEEGDSRIMCQHVLLGGYAASKALDWMPARRAAARVGSHI